jgi:pyridoxine 5-phosphate synthase
VNIDHVATVRQARRGREPDPVHAAALAILGGADGITIHLREDRRHIQDRDLHLLRQTVIHGLNLEMACANEIIELARQVRPDQATLVPERREELTTEGGLDVIANQAAVADTIKRLVDIGIPVALFIDPDLRQIDASKQLGAVAVELQTATYSEATTAQEVRRQLGILTEATAHARSIGLHVHMGHGLNYVNTRAIAAIPGVEELNIGHSIVSRALMVGMERAARDMRDAMTPR